MDIDPIEWSYEDFVSYVFIYAVNTADLGIHELEREAIISRMSEKEYDKILALFEKHTEFESVQIISRLGEIYCTDEREKQNLINQLIEVFKADHEYSAEEQNIIRALSHIL